MKVFTTAQIAQIDRYTIEHEPVSDINLMERASVAIADWICSNFCNLLRVVVLVGPGNNGGDALAVARILAGSGFNTKVYIFDFERELTGSPLINKQRLEKQGAVKLHKVNNSSLLLKIKPDDLVIDGLFGAGVSRPLSGFSKKIVYHVNSSGAKVISIDLPSGLMGEDNDSNDKEAIIQANKTLTFEFPKLSFFFSDNENYVGSWGVLPIGLHPDIIAKTDTPWHYLDKASAATLLKKRAHFSHKGSYGHALIIAGSFGKMGAAVLASKGCLKSGVGLLTVHIPGKGYEVIQSSVPEAMVETDLSDQMFSLSKNPEKFNVVGVGPGIGLENSTEDGFYKLLKSCKTPMVIDADGINILARNIKWIEDVPKNSILTPHPGEFARLVGEYKSDYKKVEGAREFASRHGIYLVLKGAHTSISCPDGRCWFNSTGNPGMATAGSGDVLTGVITGLLAQGYTPEHAALLGVFLHGSSADIATKNIGEEALVASDIASNLGKAFLHLRQKHQSL